MAMMQTRDAVGNRLLKDGQSTQATFDSANRLNTDDDFTYTYDLNGNLIQKVEIATSETTDYIYDPENQLVEVKENSVTTVTYRYDGLGRRIEKDVSGGVITRYVYDGEDILLEYDVTDTLTNRYTHGPGIDEPLILERDTNSDGVTDTSYIYHADGLGSITELTDSAGTVVQAYTYNAFGELQNAPTIIQPFTYTAREYDPETGLYYYRARTYDPAIGRFLQEDPIGFAGGDINLYPYVTNNPLTFTDPFGLVLTTDQQLRIALISSVAAGVGSFFTPAVAAATGGLASLVATAATEGSSFRDIVNNTAAGLIGGATGASVARLVTSVAKTRVQGAARAGTLTAGFEFVGLGADPLFPASQASAEEANQCP